MNKWKETDIVPRVPSNWDEYKLKELGGFKNGVNFNAQSFGKGYPVVNVKQLYRKRFVSFDGLEEIIPSSVTRIDEYKLKAGDILIGRSSVTLEGSGQVASIKSDPERTTVFSGFIIRYRLHDNKTVNATFLNYLLRTRFYKEHFINIAAGTSIVNLSQDTLKEIAINIPSLNEQESIAELLCCLDDKIDLLHRNNNSLEQLADIIFRQWLSKLTDRESTTLKEYVRVQNGYAFKSKDFKDIGNNGVLKITNISFEQVDIDNTQYVDETVVAGLSEKFIAKPKSFLIAMTGAAIGKIGIIGKTSKKLYINQRVGMLVDIIENSSLIGYLFLKSAEGQDHIINTCTGSAQENISAVGIESMIVPKSTAEEVIILCSNINPLFEKIIYNIEQIQQLETLRDTLLPKLMSGTVRVKN
jgi:type I restriction enzyme S subunit